MFDSLLVFIESWLHSDIVLVGAFAVWLITFLAGENGGLLALMVAFQGYLNLPLALVFTFLGTMSADLFWYFMTTTTLTPLFNRWYKRKLASDEVKKDRFFLSIADKYPYVLLVFIKFMVGMRLILTIYIVARQRIPFYKYLVCNVLANILFVGVLYGLAWSLQQGMNGVFAGEKGIIGLVSSLVIITIVGNVLFRVVERTAVRFLKKRIVKS